MTKVASVFCFAWLGAFNVEAALQTISSTTHHLGLVGRPEWNIFDGKVPEGEKLQLTFDARVNPREHTLFIRQDDVKQDWSVTLNGRRLGALFLMEENLVHTLAIPPNTLRDGANSLEISARTVEDILIRQIAIGDETKERLLTAGPVTISVMEQGQLVPARITLVDQNGALAPIFDYGDTNVASRPGVVYTGTGRARLKVLPGKYTIYATRGPEYNIAVVSDFDPAKASELKLEIQRQAETRGWAAADTHIHTLSLSKHGDALLRERIITLAGEAIELPVSTEHNLHADYRPAAAALGLDRYFTWIPGNEVTTKKGHFNIFPVGLDAQPPDATIEEWPALFRQMNATPSARVIVLNHPTDTHSGFTPFAVTNLNILTGRNRRGDFDFEFNAMELVNSGAMRSVWMEPFRAWFALLNRGYRITGVGSSDSHDVSRFIVGQGRTYIAVDDSDVGRIDLEKVYENFLRGRTLVSLGLIARLTISDPGSTGGSGPGDLHTPRENELELKITVQAPLGGGKSPRLTICVNGVPSEEFFAEPEEPNGFRTTVTRRVLKPSHDVHYVLLAEIQTDPAPYWGLARPYQPTSRQIRPTLIGATNPIRIDADGDSKFTSARAYAERLVSRHQDSPRELFAALAKYDYYVAVHCAELLHVMADDLESGPLADALKFAPPLARKAFKQYVESEGGPKLDE